jgi:hypothetical protein
MFMKTTKWKMLLIALAVIISSTTMAQTYTATVKGRVIEDATNNPVANYDVYIYSDSAVYPYLQYWNHVLTNGLGRYMDSVLIPLGTQAKLYVRIKDCENSSLYGYAIVSNSSPVGIVDFTICYDSSSVDSTGSGGGGSGNDSTALDSSAVEDSCIAYFDAIDSTNHTFFVNQSQTSSNYPYYYWDFGDGNSSSCQFLR